MKLEQSFEVQAPLQTVWEALIDVERVAPCLPGAAVTGKNPDGSYNGEFKVKIGPTSAAYSGKLHMEDVDEAKHSATMQAAGTDKRGQGGAKATIVSSVSEAPGGATTVHVDTDYHITGRLARFGRGGMIEEISNRLLGEFARSLQGMLAGSGDTAAAQPAAAAAAESATTEAVTAEPAPAPTEAAAPAPAAPEPAAPAPAAPASEPAASEPAAPASEPAASEPAAPEPAPAEPAPAESVPAEPAEPTPAGAAAAAGNGAAAGTPPRSEPVPPPTPPPVAPTPPTAPTAGPSQASEPLDGLALIRTVLVNRVKSNPLPFIGVVLGFLLSLRVLRRRG